MKLDWCTTNIKYTHKIPITLIEPFINNPVILSNVNIVNVTGFTKVKAEQFKCTERRGWGGGTKPLLGSAITFRVRDHCSVLG